MAGCGDVLSLEDLQTAKKHQVFEAEVITGKIGGAAGGAYLAAASNPVTGQIQETLPQILSDLGMQVQPWSSSIGGVLTTAAQIFLNDTPGSLGIGDYYAWGGPFPKTVPAGTDPALPGGGYILRSNKFIKSMVMESLRRSYAESGYKVVGTFQAGFTIINSIDVGIDETTGRGYTGPVGSVPPGTDPTSGGFIDRSNVILAQIAAAYGLNLSDGGLWATGEGVSAASWRFYSGRVWKSNTPLAVSGAVPDFVNFRYVESDGSVTPYGCGAVGDGAANDTSAIQRWLQSPEFYKKCLAGIFKIGVHTVASNSEITFGPGVQLLDSGALGATDDSITIQEVENITIYGNGVKLSQLGLYTSGEQRHGLVIGKSAKNIKIFDISPEECGGDGVYVGTQPADDAFPPVDIMLTNVVSTRNRRQGLSVTNVDGLTINGGKYRDTGFGAAGFTLPLDGIDFEPNSPTAKLKRIIVNGPELTGNRQMGIEFNLAQLNSTSEPVDVVINAPRLDNCGAGVKLNTCPAGVRGSITINNPVMHRSVWSFLFMGNWASSGVRCDIKSPRLSAMNDSNSSSADLSARGCIKIRNTGSYDIGNLYISDIDMKGSPNIAQLFSFIAEGSGRFANIFLEDQDMSKIDSTAKLQNLAAISPGVQTPQLMTSAFKRRRELAASASQDSLSGFEGGALITNRSVSGDVVSRLSSALTKTLIGTRLCFLNVTGSRMEVFIDASLSGTFRPTAYSPVSTKRLISHAAGDYVEIYTDGSDNWYIENIVGLWNGT